MAILLLILYSPCPPTNSKENVSRNSRDATKRRDSRPNNVCGDKKRQCDLSDRSDHYSVKVPGNDIAVRTQDIGVFMAYS